MGRYAKRGGTKITRRGARNGLNFYNMSGGYGYGNGFFSNGMGLRSWGYGAPALGYNRWGGAGYGGGFFSRLFYGY